MAPRKAALTRAETSARIERAFRAAMGVPADQRDAIAAAICGRDTKALRAVREYLAVADVETRRLLPLMPEGPSSDETGRVVAGRWRLGAKLGAGASGTVYDATEEGSGRVAALKLVYGIHARTVAAVRREIALLRWLRLPGVARLIDDGVVEGGVYCVMEKAEGARFPGRAVPAPWPAIESVAIGLLEAVARIHAAGVVHCDLKPANVLVTPGGAITIVDLGISAERRPRFRSRSSARAGGTPAYEAPEQRRGGRPSEGWDLYAIGVMLHEALAGVLPGDGPAPKAPARVRRLLASLTARRRTDRPRSAAAALDALRPPPRRTRRAPWTALELRPRFAGPDRLLHLREDAADELMRRTAGDPDAVEAEIGAWIRAGLAHEESGLAVVSRASLDRLRAEHGERASDRALLATLKGKDPAAVARASLAVASRLLAEGRPSNALSALFEGASAARATGDARLEVRVLRAASLAALRAARAVEIDRAVGLLQRASASDASLRGLEAALRAALHAMEGRSAQALAEIEPLCAAGAERHVLRVAWSVRNFAARALDLAEERRAVAGIRMWLAEAKVRGGDAILRTAEGWLAYREGRYAAAVESHLSAHRHAPDRDAAARCLLDAATAAVEWRPALARDLAVRARRIAEALRSVQHESRAAQIERLAVVRSGVPAAPDLELVEAVRMASGASSVAAVCLTEAVIARNAGERATARRLALTASEIWGRTPIGSLALALAAASGAPCAPERLAEAGLAAAAGLPAAVGLQVLALLAEADPSSRAGLLEASRKLALPPSDSDEVRVREVMSVEAARAALRA